VAPFPKESVDIHPRPWSVHLHPRRRHPSPFIPHSIPRFHTQTRKDTTPKKTTTHSIGKAPVRLATTPTPTSSPSTWIAPLAKSCPTLHPLPLPSVLTLPCEQLTRTKNSIPPPWDASLRGLLGRYSPQTQISMPVSSARSRMASSKRSVAAKTLGTMRNKNLKPGTKAWKNASFYTRRHWRRCQRDMSSMATESKSGSPLAKDSLSSPTSSNSCQMDASLASPPEKVSKTCHTLSNSTPLTIAPLETSSSPCLTGWTAPYGETLISSRLCPPRSRDWMIGGSPAKYTTTGTSTPASTKFAARWRSWKPPSPYSRGNKSTATTASTKHTLSTVSPISRCLHATRRGLPNSMVGVPPHSLVRLLGSTKRVDTLSRGGVMSPASRTAWSKQGNRPSVRSISTSCLCRGYPASCLHRVL
jgi:hypothetical protein